MDIKGIGSASPPAILLILPARVTPDYRRQVWAALSHENGRLPRLADNLIYPIRISAGAANVAVRHHNFMPHSI